MCGTWRAEESGPVSIDDLSELYWGPGHGVAHRVAVVFHLAREPLYFEEADGGYLARSEEAVRETLERREREARNAAEADALVEGLASGSLPSSLSAHQRALLGHVRGLVVHGDSYTRSAAAAALVKRIDPGARDAQRLGFDLLVGAGLMSSDEPLELERAGIPDRFPEETLDEARASGPKPRSINPAAPTCGTSRPSRSTRRTRPTATMLYRWRRSRTGPTGCGCTSRTPAR